MMNFGKESEGVKNDNLDKSINTKESNDNEKEVTIKDLYPDLTREQQEQADDLLDRYLSIVKEIFEENL